ncbi:MAG TPA: hypothetical protein VNM72_10955 [Blastocatellia bacterium]|nr:hypothetical protein [Blastocatellia bacterium]
MPPHSQTFTDLAPGSYTVTEGAVPGWALTNLVCTDPDNVTTVDLNTRTATIDLDAGETVKRTFTNTRVEVNLLVLQGSGNCLEVDRDRGTYRFRAADGRVFTGAVILSQRGDLLSLQSPLLRGVTDLRRRLGAATLVLPFGPGRRVFSFVDRNIDDNTLCP